MAIAAAFCTFRPTSLLIFLAAFARGGLNDGISLLLDLTGNSIFLLSGFNFGKELPNYIGDWDEPSVARLFAFVKKLHKTTAIAVNRRPRSATT